MFHVVRSVASTDVHHSLDDANLHIMFPCCEVCLGIPVSAPKAPQHSQPHYVSVSMYRVIILPDKYNLSFPVSLVVILTWDTQQITQMCIGIVVGSDRPVR